MLHRHKRNLKLNEYKRENQLNETKWKSILIECLFIELFELVERFKKIKSKYKSSRASIVKCIKNWVKLKSVKTVKMTAVDERTIYAKLEAMKDIR